MIVLPSPRGLDDEVEVVEADRERHLDQPHQAGVTSSSVTLRRAILVMKAAPRRVGSGGFFFGPRSLRHAYRNVSGDPARVLVLSVPSCGLDRMLGELHAATAAGVSAVAEVEAICAKYGVTIEPPADLIR